MNWQLAKNIAVQYSDNSLASLDELLKTVEFRCELYSILIDDAEKVKVKLKEWKEKVRAVLKRPPSPPPSSPSSLGGDGPTIEEVE